MKRTKIDKKEQIAKAVAQITLTPDIIQRLAKVHALVLQHREERLKANNQQPK